MENGPGQYEEMPERVHEPDAFFAVKQDTGGVEHPAEDEQDHAGRAIRRTRGTMAAMTHQPLAI